MRGIVIALVAVYLVAIVSANLAVATWGPPALALTAWVLIPFDMVTRDSLQLAWASTGRTSLALKMGALIAAGSALTWIASSGAGRIALASCTAFSTASAVDAFAFAAGQHRLTRLQRVNVSNVLAFVTDSIVFQLVAFGGIDWSVGASQAGAKTLGGALWSLLIARTIWRMPAFRVATLQQKDLP